jgi:asparagine synthase (glutamine-hydrolysing)
VVHLLIESAYRWHCSEDQGIRFWSTGSEKAGKALFSFFKGAEQPGIEEVGRFLARLDGHFGFVVELPNRVFAGTDKIRSYPVFYACQGERFGVSNSARAVRDSFRFLDFDPLSVLEFQMAGYVSGPDTLLEGLKQLQAAEVLVWDKKENRLSRERYFLFYSALEKETSLSRGIERLDTLTEEVFRKAVESLNGRPAMIPLSGGLDSRLVACMLKLLKYDNVLCYSYGLEGNWESRASREIAERLGVRWIFVPYDRKRYRSMYRDPDTAAYFRFGDGLSVLPFIQDRLCLLEMIEKGLVPSEGVFINGNSGDFSTGGHIPAVVMDHASGSWERLFQGIVGKHYSLWESRKTQENLSKISAKVRSTIQDLSGEDPDTATSESLASLYEAWEWQERQSKYVVNGQRVYDYLGYSWLLPHWDDLYLDFWSRVSPELKFGQELYKAYLEAKDFFGLFKTYEPERYVSPRFVSPLRTLARVAVAPFGKNLWHRVDKSAFAYFTENLQTYSPFSYFDILSKKGGFRHAISLRVEDYLRRLQEEITEARRKPVDPVTSH